MLILLDMVYKAVIELLPLMPSSNDFTKLLCTSACNMHHQFQSVGSDVLLLSFVCAVRGVQ